MSSREHVAPDGAKRVAALHNAINISLLRREDLVSKMTVLIQYRSTKAVISTRRDTPRKRVILALFLVALSVSSCFRKSPPETQRPILAPTPTPSSTTLPKQLGPINDFANVFDPSEKSRLEFSINELHANADVEFVVVTVDTTNSQSISDYSLALAREWKPGGNSGRGLLLVLAIKSKQWRLQVSKALERELPDDVCKQLGEPSVEFYKEGKFVEGVERYVRALGDRLQAMKSQSFKSAVFSINPVRLAMRANESTAYRREALTFDVQSQPQMQAQ